MMFDGVGFAKEIEEGLRRGGKLVGKKLVIFETGGRESVYVRLKREMGKRLGVEVTQPKAVHLGGRNASVSEADGVVVQLPVEDLKILKLIPPEKDVDGLNPNGSRFLPAVVVAVEKVLKNFKVTEQLFLPMQNPGYGTLKLGVVGSKGMVGKALLNRLKELDFGQARMTDVIGVDVGDDLGELESCDVVISATGQAGLIKPEMVKEGVVAIDLGYPKGDFDPAVAKKAKFFTPVPGGVGPVTVVSLFENLSKVS